MAHKHERPHPHAEFRHRSQVPMPAVEDVEQRLVELLSSSLLAPRQMERRDPRQPQRLIRMRQRLLSLPVIVAIVVSLVWRRMPAVAEVQKVLAREGWLWVAPVRVSAQALTKRLDVLPAAVMGQLLTEVCARLQVQAPAAVPHPSWAPVREHFPRLAIVDGSTLEALRQKTQVLQQRESPVLGGGLLVFDLGFFSFLWFDDFTTSHRFFVTCMREKTAYRTVRELSSSPYYRDAIIAVGQYRSNPCQYPLRMVSVQWQGVWYRYLTNVLDPQVLSACHVCELYRRRWWIEDAFALTKGILDLAY